MSPINIAFHARARAWSIVLLVAVLLLLAAIVAAWSATRPVGKGICLRPTTVDQVLFTSIVPGQLVTTTLRLKTGEMRTTFQYGLRPGDRYCAAWGQA